MDGWYVQGRGSVADTLATRVGRVKSYHASAGADVTGTFVMVLYLDGRRWKIRSYVERPVGA